MKYSYLLLALASVALFSCTRSEVEDPDAGGVHVTIHASQEGAADTRTTLVDGGTQVYWEPSDEIKVFFRGSGSRFLSQNTANAQVTDFSGSLNVVVGINEGASGSNTLWGLYPYRADATSDGASVTTTLPAEQTGRAGSFAKNTHITLAQSNCFDLAFYNVTGGIRFSLTQEGVKEVIFEGQNNENIAGKVKLAFANGVPAVQKVVEGQKTITLSAPNGGTFETGKWYYIVALPGTLSNGFKMTFNTATQYATLKSSGSKTIKRGIFGSLADADENLVYKDKGDEPPVTGNIVFADIIAKYACVAKFDTNGDGEVSVEEAEAATSFNGLFTDWKAVESFDEINYFKNVHSINGVFRDCNKLVSITIPDNITNLGTFAFAGCSSLTTVVLPEGITSIGNDTFFTCNALVSVNIPSTVKSIGTAAFRGCNSLNSVELPSQLKTIGAEAFYGCAFSEILIPDSVTSLGVSAFNTCSNLNTVYIPYGITTIPASCFAYCRSLKSISIPANITSIGNEAFSGDYMWKIELPSSVTSLGSKCFGKIACVLLQSTSPVSIQSDTFDNVDGIFVPSNLMDMYGAMTNWTNYINKLHPLTAFKDRDEYVLGTNGAVDMGLSVNWAAFNLGAVSPEEYGNHYAWGETETKSVFTWDTYFDSINGSSSSFRKYNKNGKTILDSEDDAARQQWGKTWRMPTYDELIELQENCLWEWTTYHGTNGSMVYSVITGNKIFIPAAGEIFQGSHEGEGVYGFYFSSMLATKYSDSSAWILDFGVNDYSVFLGQRCEGFSIRPVCD